MEDIARLAAHHSNPLLALKAYASFLTADSVRDVSRPTSTGTNRSRTHHHHHHGNRGFYLADFVLRCNGLALGSLQGGDGPEAAAVHPARDFFSIALTGLLPAVLGRRPDSEAGSGPIRADPSANIEGDSNDGGEEDSCGTSPADVFTFPDDPAAYTGDLRLLEARLEDVSTRLAGHGDYDDDASRDKDTAAATPAGTQAGFILLTLTLSNWACAELRFRNVARGLVLLRCSAAARRCASLLGDGGASSSPFSHHSPTHGDNHDDSAASNRSSSCSSGGGASEVGDAWWDCGIATAVTDLNACALQLMLCNGPEAHAAARNAMLALTPESNGGGVIGVSPGDEQFLRAIGFIAAGAAGEYEQPEGSVASYHAAGQALWDPAAVPAGAASVPPRSELTFTELAMRARASSLLAQLTEHVTTFAAEARAGAIAAAAMAEAAAAAAYGGGGGPGGRRGKSKPGGGRGGRSVSIVGAGQGKGGAGRLPRAGSSGAAAAELVLVVPPIDSVLRTSIRCFGLPVAVFDVLPMEAALRMLVPAEELAGAVSPFDTAAVPTEGNAPRPLCVAGVIVPMETPLHWAVEAAALAASPPAQRYSVWSPPPPPPPQPQPLAAPARSQRYPYQQQQGQLAAVTEAGPPAVAAAPGPDEPLSRVRLAQYQAVARCRERDGVDCLDDNNEQQQRRPSPGGTASWSSKPPVRGAPSGFLAASLGPPPPASALDGAKKGVDNAVKLLSGRLANLIAADKAFEARWAATERVRCALMAYWVPRQLAAFKAGLLERRRFQAAREDRCARVLVRFFRRVVEERPRLQGFLSRDERRAMAEDAAAIVLQKHLRRWLAVRERRRRERLRSRVVAGVTRVQSLFRRRKATARVEAVRVARRAAAEREAAADHQEFAALLIQRVYRGHAARLRHWVSLGQHDRALRHHLRDSRHFFATQIQRRVRGMLVRREYGRAVQARCTYGRNACRAAVLTASCIVIQRCYRAYQVRRQRWDAASAADRLRWERESVGFFFKCYLGPDAVPVFPNGPCIRANATFAAAEDGVGRAADGTRLYAVEWRGSKKETTPEGLAAVKIQSTFRRWMAARTVNEMHEARRAVIALREGEAFRPFVTVERDF